MKTTLLLLLGAVLVAAAHDLHDADEPAVGRSLLADKTTDAALEPACHEEEGKEEEQEEERQMFRRMMCNRCLRRCRRTCLHALLGRFLTAGDGGLK